MTNPHQGQNVRHSNRLEGSVVAITGAASGNGRASALRTGREGALDKLHGEDKLNAGKLRASKEGKLRIEVEDVDSLTPNDPAGTVELDIMSLHEGVNDIRYDEKTEQNAIKRLLIRLVLKDQPMEDIVREMR